MNILFLSTRSPYPLISGHSLRTYHILKGVAQNHKVTFLTFIQLPEHELKGENLGHLRGLCSAIYPFRIPSDSSRFRLGASLICNLPSPLPFVVQKYNVAAMRERIREILEKEEIDLVHVDMLPLTVYLNEFSHLPKILVNHNVESIRLYRWLQTESNPGKKAYLAVQWLKLRRFERSAVSKYDASVVVSEADRDLLREMGAMDRVFVVQNGTDTEFFRPSSERPTDHLVVWVGHMDVHTNRDAALYFWKKIYPLLRSRHPQVQVMFVGTAPPDEISRAAKVNPNIRVTGFVNDIRPYVAKAAVMVAPIRIGSGTRLKILDLMAMGKAIVSTSVGCEGLHLEDGKNIMIADDPQTYVDKIVLVLGNEELRASLGLNARNAVLEYDWKYMGGLQEQVYEYAMARKGKE